MRELPDLIKQWIEGSIEPPPVVKLLDITLLECDYGTAKVKMKVDNRHHNPMGSVHGGIFCDLADIAMGVAVASTLKANESFSTVELHVNYIHPIVETVLIADARVVHRGRKITLVTCEMFDDQDRLVTRSSSTCLIQR